MATGARDWPEAYHRRWLCGPSLAYPTCPSYIRIYKCDRICFDVAESVVAYMDAPLFTRSLFQNIYRRARVLQNIRDLFATATTSIPHLLYIYRTVHNHYNIDCKCITYNNVLYKRATNVVREVNKGIDDASVCSGGDTRDI